jgi:hypothetical protein
LPSLWSWRFCRLCGDHHRCQRGDLAGMLYHGTIKGPIALTWSRYAHLATSKATL